MNKSNKHVDLNFQKDGHDSPITMYYKALYQLNDVVLGLVFLIGSFLFFSDSTVFSGTVLFFIGSIQMTIRPLIAFFHDLHLARYHQKQQKLNK